MSSMTYQKIVVMQSVRYGVNMARNIITKKNPHRTLRESDNSREIIQKINQNFTLIWQILNNLDDRLKTLENKRNVEIIRQSDTEIEVPGIKNNGVITLNGVS